MVRDTIGLRDVARGIEDAVGGRLRIDTDRADHQMRVPCAHLAHALEDLHATVEAPLELTMLVMPLADEIHRDADVQP